MALRYFGDRTPGNVYHPDELLEVFGEVKVVNVVRYPRDVVPSMKDADDAVVMSFEHFNSLMKTVHLLKNPANTAHLAESIKQFQSGKSVERGLIDD